MSEATILSVNPNKKEWAGEKGTFAIIEGQLRDGRGEAKWSVMCKPENEQKTRQELSAIVNQPGDFTLEQKQDYQGVRQFKLKAWPGKPAQGGFGGKGGSYPPRYRDTQEGLEREQRSIHRSVALTQAVAYHNPIGERDPVAVLKTADAFYHWLAQEDPQRAPQGEKTPQTAPASPAPSFDAQKAARAAMAMLEAEADYGTEKLSEAWAKLPETSRKAIHESEWARKAYASLKAKAVEADRMQNTPY